MSRDPAGEKQSRSLTAFLGNDSVSDVDPRGLNSLRYHARGEVFWDPKPWYLGRSFDYSADASGYQPSTTAWYWQMGREIECPGGLCNSDDTGGHSSSYVEAFVKNLCNKSVTVSCKCSVSFSGFTSVPYHYGKHGGFSVNATILERFFYQLVNTEEVSDGRTRAWMSIASDTFEHSASMRLAPFEERQLYYGELPVALPPDMPDAAFFASMRGTCSCTQGTN